MSTVITVILSMAAVVLTVSALIAAERIATGPSQLDRSIGADLLVAVVIGAVGVWAVSQQQDTEVIAVLLLSMVGFTGAVSVARMVGERVVQPRDRKPKPTKDKDQEASA